MKGFSYILLAAAAGVSMTACEREFERDDSPIAIFSVASSPIIATEGESLQGTRLVLNYKYGGNKQVSISVPEQSGIWAEPIVEQLNADEGSCSLPLSGSNEEAGVLTLDVKISYGVYHIFCPFSVVVRPDPLPEVPILVEPALTGQLYEHLPASNARLTVGYKNGWARTVSVRFESADPGISQEVQNLRLADDDSSATLEVPLAGTPQTHGLLDITAYVRFEGAEQEQSYLFEDVEILQAIPYEEETVRHEIIVTPRSELMAGAAIQTSTFEYKTVFVDMNGDGYVSSNAEIWLDRNVGALSNDPMSEDSYGFIYQPGRDAPGWVSNSQTGNDNTNYKGERYKRNNMTWFNGTASDVQVPLLDADGKATAETVTIPAGKVGPNNPCPYGFRPPHASEWKALYDFLNCSVTNYEALRTGLLGIPFVTSIIDNVDGEKIETRGSYWCAPFDDNQVPAAYFFNATLTSNRPKGYAMPIRCIKAKEEELMTYAQ